MRMFNYDKSPTTEPGVGAGYSVVWTLSISSRENIFRQGAQRWAVRDQYGSHCVY